MRSSCDTESKDGGVSTKQLMHHSRLSQLSESRRDSARRRKSFDVWIQFIGRRLPVAQCAAASHGNSDAAVKLANVVQICSGLWDR